MAEHDTPQTDPPDPARPQRRRQRRVQLRVLAARALAGAVALVLGLVLILSAVPLPATPYMIAERWRLGALAHEWVALRRVAPVMARAAVAAEDANFCLHWGFDMEAIRDAIDEGRGRGASTISQQVAKNVFLWQGRSWPRKALEAALTPLIEALWSKRRILEVYLNVAEFGRGTWGVQAAAQKFFGKDAARLTRREAATLAAVLPNPKRLRVDRPSPYVQRRRDWIMAQMRALDQPRS